MFILIHQMFRIETEGEFKATLDKIPDYEIQEEDVSNYQLLLEYQLWFGFRMLRLWSRYPCWRQP